MFFSFLSKISDPDKIRFKRYKFYVVLSLLLFAKLDGMPQKLDRNFGRFYTHFQEAIAQDDQNQLKNLCHFPFQTIYWIDGINHLSEEEKQDGLLDSVAFGQYENSIFNTDVKRLVPNMGLERVQQIDLNGSGDYYRRLGKVIDERSTLLELYCQFSQTGSGIGDDYFAFLFGKINGEYRVLAYYTKTRLKE